MGYILPGEMMRLGLNLNYLSNSKTNGFDKTDSGVTTKVSQAKINSLSGDLNAYLDIKKFNHFTPYLTAGVGMARNSISGLKVSQNGELTQPSGVNGHQFNQSSDEVKSATTTSNSYKGSNTAFTYNVGAGVMYDINEDFSVDVSYRFKDHGKVKAKRVENIDLVAHTGDKKEYSTKLKTHNIMFGVAYKF